MNGSRLIHPRLSAMTGVAVVAAAAVSVLAACAPATASTAAASAPKATARPAAPAAPKANARQAAPAARSGQAARAVPAGDTPPGFWYGTDSTQMAVGGSGPYTEPVIGGNYGGYVGMAGNWAHWQGCPGSGKLIWSSTNAQQAATNHSKYGKGVGVSAYWFMAGPGVDPHYDGTVSQATSWGQQQAARAIADVSTSTENYPVLWMDIELPGNAPTFTPAPDNGWNSVYTSACSGKTTAGYIDPSVDRAVVDGFSSYLKAHSSLPARGVLGPVDLAVYLRHRQPGPDPRHLRVDLHGQRQPRPPAVGLVPEDHLDLRALLRRAAEHRQNRRHVAVVGRRRCA